jgi:hypothetical protein
MDRESALDKIRKCLALSKSSNANEAAIALRQAQKLMQEFGIDPTIAHSPKIDEAAIRPNGVTVTHWEISLAITVAATLGIRSYRAKNNGMPQTIYYGNADRVSLAEYAHVSLRRAIIKARTEYVLNLSFTGQYKTKDLRRLSKAFAIGFAQSIRDSVQSLFEETPEEAHAIEVWKSERGLALVKGRRFGFDATGAAAGRAAGANFSMKRPMGGELQQLIGRD